MRAAWPTVGAVVVVVTGLCWRATVAHSQAPTPMPTPSGQHTALAPSDMKWGEAPPVFRKGAKMSVLYGDPAKDGALYVVLLRVPANYRIAPHWHPRDENVTVLSGSMGVGMGDTFDATVKALPAGTFYSMPAGMSR